MANNALTTRRAAIVGTAVSVAALAVPVAAQVAPATDDVPLNLKRYVGTPEFALMAAIDMMQQVAKEYDPTIKGVWVGYSDDDLNGNLRLSHLSFDRSGKALERGREQRGE